MLTPAEILYCLICSSEGVSMEEIERLVAACGITPQAPAPAPRKEIPDPLLEEA